jgi:hypothetical protein
MDVSNSPSVPSGTFSVFWEKMKKIDREEIREKLAKFLGLPLALLFLALANVIPRPFPTMPVA